MNGQTAVLPSLEDVRTAFSRIHGRIHRTPLATSHSLSDRIGCELRLKCENLQRAGSFKIRGALNAMLQLTPEEQRRGVVAFSSGNHAQGVALGARMLGLSAIVVMPEGSTPAKVAATEGYGARVVTSGVTAATRGDVARKIAEETGAVVIPPFDDERIIAGAGTVGLELVTEWPEVRRIVVPLGGGGLLAGVALAATSLDPSIEVWGVEPEAGNDGEQSFRSGRIVEIAPPQTIADGARTTAIGTRNFEIIRKRVTNIVSVPDDVLREATEFAMYRTKLVIEPTGALGIAALMSGRIPADMSTVAVISGGNIDWKVLG